MNIKPDSNVVKMFLTECELTRLNQTELKNLYGEDVEFINNLSTDTQGFMRPLDDGKKVIISFRGTQQSKDWLTDLNGFHTDNELIVPYNNDESSIRVHSGFIGAYHSVRFLVHRFLNRYQPDEAMVCGHSLGAALATLCAVDIQYNYLAPVIKCFSSGSPKVGNAAFAKSYNKRVPYTIRTYMRRDIVPNLPPSWVEEIFNQKSVHVGIKNPIGPTNFFYGIFNWFKRRNDFDDLAADITNHSIDLYRKFA